MTLFKNGDRVKIKEELLHVIFWNKDAIERQRDTIYIVTGYSRDTTWDGRPLFASRESLSAENLNGSVIYTLRSSENPRSSP